MQTYTATPQIELLPQTIAGISLNRTATLNALIVNYKAKQIALSWQVSYSTSNGQPFDAIPPYEVQQLALETMFIHADGTTAAWSISELLEQYGIWNPDENRYQTNPDGSFTLTNAHIMDGFSFYMAVSKKPVPLFNLLVAAGTRAAAENRLDKTP